MHVLDGIGGLAAGKCVAIPPAGLSVGKRADNDLCLPDDYVSRVHARFSLEGDAAWLTDAGSTNGTFVNGLQVQRHRLRPGDEIQIGGSLLRYRDRPAAVLQPDAGPAPAATAIRTVRRPPPAPPGVVLTAAARATAALAELARARPGTLAPEAALERILALLFDALPVDRGCIVLLNEQGEPVPAAVRYLDPTAAVEDMPLSRTLLRRALESGSALLIADTMLEADLAGVASILARRLRCVAYLPLLFGEETIGALCLDAAAGQLAEADLDTLVPFADQAALVAYQARLQQAVARELRRREMYQRFVPPAVLEQHLRDGTEPALGGEEREVTVLFADLRGYTTLAEQIPPQEAVGLLNAVFERLGAAVLAQGGTLDKYIGDCVMALFGAPFGETDHCRRAVRTALAMQAEMRRLGEELAARYQGLAIGIAINTGPAVVGNIGSEARMDYTAIGDTVNVAARVEDLAGPGETLVTERVAALLGGSARLEPRGPVTLRGREQATAVYAVLGLEDGVQA